MLENTNKTKPKTHNLKTESVVFEAVRKGLKTYELRYNDRDYQVGDVLVLKEVLIATEDMTEGKVLRYTGRKVIKKISHILEGYGLMPGWMNLSFEQDSPPAAPAAPEKSTEVSPRIYQD